MKEALIKMVEFTTFRDPNIIALEMPMHECPSNRAIYFIDKTTGASMYFRANGIQKGKLWSVTRFNPIKIAEMSTNPGVVVITSSNQNSD